MRVGTEVRNRLTDGTLCLLKHMMFTVDTVVNVFFPGARRKSTRCVARLEALPRTVGPTPKPGTIAMWTRSVVPESLSGWHEQKKRRVG
jgi:hypothetical protein